MRKIEEQIIASLQSNGISRFAGAPVRQKNRPHQICLVEPVNVFGRSQPVSVELLPIQHSTVEVLSLKTPLGGEDNYRELLGKYPIYQFPYEQEYPMVKMCYDKDCAEDDLFRVYMRLDIPLMPLQPNALSAYELNQGLYDLVECGDLVERIALSGQDLSTTDLRKGKSIEASELEEGQLRKKVYSDALSAGWQKAFNPKYVYLNSIFHDDHRSIRQHWASNHEHPFVKFTAFRESTEVYLYYFSKDLQREEQDFLIAQFSKILERRVVNRSLISKAS